MFFKVKTHTCAHRQLLWKVKQYTLAQLFKLTGERVRVQNELWHSYMTGTKKPGVALSFRDLRQSMQNIMYFASMAQKMRTL